MRSLRWFPPLLAVLTLAGCAAPQNTLAQDLAWERWRQCSPDKYPGMMLDRITPDGTVYMLTMGPGASMWQECMKQAAIAQGQRRAVVAPPPSGAVRAPVAPMPASAPLIRPGSEWAYRWESPRGKGTFVWTLDREDTRDGDVFYVVRSGAGREIYWRKRDLAYYMDVVNGEVETRRSPPQEIVRWPLEVGLEWEQTFISERPKERQTNEMQAVCRIESQDTVTVPAGTFRAFKSVCRNKRNGQTMFEGWYSPEVGSVVRELSTFSYGVRERELIQYRLR